MMLTVYESVYALSSIYNETLINVMTQIGLTTGVTNNVMLIANLTYAQKFKLIGQKVLALTNVVTKTAAMSDSSAKLLNNAYEAAVKSYNYRLNLEIAILDSQLKSIEVENAGIKLMSAADFTAKYGA